MTLLPKSSGLRLDGTFIDADAVSLTLASTSLPVVCPVCGQTTAHLHNHYGRTVADLPWSGRRVQLFLRVRKFRCRPGDGVDVTFVTQKRVAFATTLPISPARRTPSARSKRLLRLGGAAYTSSSAGASAKEEDAWGRRKEQTEGHENASKG